MELSTLGLWKIKPLTRGWCNKRTLAVAKIWLYVSVEVSVWTHSNDRNFFPFKTCAFVHICYNHGCSIKGATYATNRSFRIQSQPEVCVIHKLASTDLRYCNSFFSAVQNQVFVWSSRFRRPCRRPCAVFPFPDLVRFLIKTGLSYRFDFKCCDRLRVGPHRYWHYIREREDCRN